MPRKGWWRTSGICSVWLHIASRLTWNASRNLSSPEVRRRVRGAAKFLPTLDNRHDHICLSALKVGRGKVGLAINVIQLWLRSIHRKFDHEAFDSGINRQSAALHGELFSAPPGG